MKHLIFCFLFLVLFQPVFSQDTTWDYDGPYGPKNWGELPGNSFCSSGKNQSPINLEPMVSTALSNLIFDYRYSPEKIVNTGYSIQLRFSDKMTNIVLIDKKKFSLKYIEFHAPGEHTINGQSFPLEAHFVHADDNDHLAILAVLFEYNSKKHPVMNRIFKNLPSSPGDSNSFGFAFDETTILPDKKDYFRYNGSLTIPPCTEGIRWIVLKSTQHVSRENVNRFANTLGKRTNRPTQNINARLILN